MTVLLILVVCVTQLTNGTASTVIQSRKYIDADSQARAVFSRMSFEFENMLLRPDVDFSTFKSPGSPAIATVSPPVAAVAANLQTGGNDQFAFYTVGQGYYSGTSSFTNVQKAPVSLVAYSVQADPYRSGVTDFQRVNKALGWDSDSGNAWKSVAYLPLTLTTQWPTLFANDPDTASVGDQIFRFEYTYLLKPNLTDSSGTIYPSKLSVTPWWTNTNGMASSAMTSHNYLNGFSDVAAIVVAIAVLDPNSRAVLSTSNYASLIAALPDAQDGTDIGSSWVAAINLPTFAATAQIPKSSASAVRVYQRFFYLDSH